MIPRLVIAGTSSGVGKRLRHGDVTEEGHVAGAVHASYLHTHWAATADVARRLVAIAARAREVPA